MTTPRISVVVAFFNNEDDLGDCLDSIAAQTFADLEVIMVDDASSDHSAEIARAKAAADPRFTLLQPEHGGPGGARNRGVERARGEYLAFVDGDDVLPANAYELLLHALERSGSDFVSGAVYRVGPNGISPSALHSLAIKGRQTGTHVTRTPRLLYDVSVWNKLFRRSFWDAHQLSYPEGVVWEDLRLMTKAHVLARAVDVIPDTVYYWRERAHGRLSITQSRASVANLRDRMTAMNDIDQFIAAHSHGTRLLRAHQRKALKNDLWLYVQDLHKVTDAYRAEFTDLVNGYLDHVGRRVLRSLPAPHKLAYHLVRIRAMPQLAELAAWMVEQPVRQVPWSGGGAGCGPTCRSARIPAPVPIPFPRIPPALARPGPVHARGRHRLGPGRRLVVTGRANVPSIDIPRRRNTSKIVVLRPPGPGTRRLPVVLPVRSFLHPKATALSEQDRYNYDWSGFRFAVTPRRFRGTGEWQCYMLVRGHGVWRPARVHTPVPGPAERPRPRQVAPGRRFGARWAGRGLNLAAWRLSAVVTAVAWQDADPRAVRIDVELPVAPARGRLPAARVPAELVLVRNQGAATRSFPAAPVESRPGSPARFSALVPLSDLAAAADVVDRARPGGWRRRDGLGRLPQAARPAPGQGGVAGRPPETRHLFGAREAVAGQSRYGDLVIAERAPRPVIDEHEWRPGGRLVLRGSFLGPAIPGPAGPARSTRRCCAGSGPPTRTSSASPCGASGSASRPTWTGCRSSARPSRCGTASGICTSARRAADPRR